MNKKIIILPLIIVSLAVGFVAMGQSNNYNAEYKDNTNNSDNTSIVVGPGQSCGGNMLNPPRCGDGYHCGPAAGQTLPVGDVGGICIIDYDQQVNANNQENQDNNSEIDGDSHRSSVATFVQNLLNVANREKGGIGDQVRKIANAQNDSKDEVANKIDKVKGRNGFATFLVGTDFKTIGELRSDMVTTGNQIDQLTTLLGKTTIASDKVIIQTQIDALKLQQQKINDFINANESKFSLFGWLVKLFNR
jgi:hypothetical protein